MSSVRLLTPETKIVVLTPPLTGRGGIERYVKILIKTLGAILVPDSVEIMSLPSDKSRTRNTRFAARVAQRSFQSRPALIICSHVALSPIADLVKRARGTPYWVSVYGAEVWGILSRSKRAGLNRADLILSISAFTKQRLIESFDISEDRITILPCAVDDALIKQAQAADGKIERRFPDDRVLLTVGRLASEEKHKGHDTVLTCLPTVLRENPTTRYVIVGDGSYRAHLERRARELGVGDRVSFVGTVTDEELGAFYSECEVYVMPSTTRLGSEPMGEGFGIAYIEAMAFGKPVIGPNVGAPMEFILDGEHGLLVDPRSPREVSDAILELMRSSRRRAEMGDRARLWVTQQYSTEAFSERLSRLLKDRFT